MPQRSLRPVRAICSSITSTAPIEVRRGLGEGASLWRDIAVVEREERRAKLGEELERSLKPGTRRRHAVLPGLQPRTIEGAAAEDV